MAAAAVVVVHLVAVTFRSRVSVLRVRLNVNIMERLLYLSTTCTRVPIGQDEISQWPVEHPKPMTHKGLAQSD